MNNQSFLSVADDGKNGFWRYAVGTILIVFSWVLFSALLGTLFPPEASGGSPLVSAISLLSFLPVLVVPMVVVRVLHGRPAGTLIGPAKRLNWGRIGRATLLWLALFAAMIIVGVILFGLSNYELNLAGFLNNLPAVFLYLILIPIQASAEEVFFRGYLLQAFGRLTRNWLILIVINSVFFALPHMANPEVGAAGPVLAALNWVASAVFFTLITLRSGSLDYAIGAHVINNLAATILVGYPDSAMMGNVALVMSKELDAVFSLVTFVAAAAIAYVLLTRSTAKEVESPLPKTA